VEIKEFNQAIKQRRDKKCRYFNGIAVVGSVLEQYGGETGQALALSADGVVVPMTNMLEISNTVVGTRSNLFYQDTGTETVIKDGVSSCSLQWEWNCKTDVFGTNANLVGNWAAVHRVGSKYRAAINGSSDGNNSVGVGKWLGEVAALGDSGGPIAPDFVSDASYQGTRAGNGDYTPGASTAIPQVPWEHCAYPWDLYGRDVPQGGTAFVGAVQRAA